MRNGQRTAVQSARVHCNGSGRGVYLGELLAVHHKGVVLSARLLGVPQLLDGDRCHAPNPPDVLLHGGHGTVLLALHE